MTSGFITIIYCGQPFQRNYSRILQAALTFKESTSTFRDKKKKSPTAHCNTFYQSSLALRSLRLQDKNDGVAVGRTAFPRSMAERGLNPTPDTQR